MEKTTEKTKIVQSNVKVGAVVALPKKPVPVVVRRTVSCQTIVDEITSRVTGKLIGFDDIYDPKTNTFLTDSELKKKGAVIITVSLNKVLSENDVVKKSRITKEETPFIRKTTKYQVIANVNWTSYINKRGSGNFVSAEQKANGIENYNNCKATGKTKAGNFTINGVILRSLEKTRYFDENNREYQDIDKLKTEYLKTQSKASKQKEADKHGIDVRFDPKYRTTRIDSCDTIRVFGFEYIPTE